MKRFKRFVSRYVFAWLLMGCGDAPQLPAAAEPLPSELVTVSLAAWREAGLPDASGCEPPYWVELNAVQFEATCKMRSCTNASEGEYCFRACTVPVGDAAVAYWDQDYPSAAVAKWRDQAHETFHVFAHCTLGSWDAEHAVEAVWSAALTRVLELAPR